MDYYNCEIKTSTETVEILIALLSELGFDTFEETEEGLHAYIPKKQFVSFVKEEIEKLKNQFAFDYHLIEIPHQNWNAAWESSFQPVIVDDFCVIRASFHPPIPDVQFDLLINPKMAFGTGHHETTFMMIERMQTLDFEGKKVLDFGCGTGVLAILASKLKAAYLDAVDIEEEAYLNTVENAEINQVSNINALEGTLETITESGFDIILANINRNVILNSLTDLYEKLKKGGTLVISGILQEDKTLVLQSAKMAGFTVKKEKAKNNWLCISLEK